MANTTHQRGLVWGHRYVSALPVSPGEILQREFLEQLEISQRSLARAIGVPVMLISEIIRGKRGVTADTVMRLARYFGTTPEFWLSLQAGWELSVVAQKKAADYRGITPHDRVQPPLSVSSVAISGSRDGSGLGHR